jgi:hypothetical protein
MHKLKQLVIRLVKYLIQRRFNVHELPLALFAALGKLSVGMILLSGLLFLPSCLPVKLALIQKINIEVLIFMAIGMKGLAVFND